jgi:uncharacterized protein (TIGR00725 family)
MVDIESVRARVLAATDGVWQRHGTDVWLERSVEPAFRGRDGSSEIRRQADRDAEFVAHARSDILALLDLLDDHSGLSQPNPADRDEDSEKPQDHLFAMTSLDAGSISSAAPSRDDWRTGPRPIVAIIGPSDAPEPVRALARRVGALLGQLGVPILTGGLGGVMAAASQGVVEAGGIAIGLLPGENRSAANEHCTVAIATGLGQARNTLVIGAADGVIAVGGSWGTLNEVALAHRTNKPTVCLAGWTVHDSDGELIPLRVADSADNAVDLLGSLLGWPQPTSN